MTTGSWIIGTDNGSKLSTNGTNMYDSYSVDKNDTNGHTYSRIGSIN